MTIRVLVVDDSVVVRRSVADILGAEDDVQVVATAPDGHVGLRRIEEHHPDVVTLDVEMPGMDGIATLREIRARWPRLPVVMYSTLTARGAATTLEALSLGAADYATKPERATNREEVAAQVREALLPIVRLWGSRTAKVLSPAPAAGGTGAPSPSVPSAPAAGTELPTGRPVWRRVGPPRLAVVGVSTGGPDALATVVPALPVGLRVPVVVVQHMPPVFTRMLAERLDRQSAVRVTEAVDGERPLPGHVYVAPGGCHTEVRADAEGLQLVLTEEPPENSCRPAVDVLFRTACEATRGRLVAFVLTGMGADGREGARLVRDAGGVVVAQDEPTSVVWGMPGFVARDGTADSVLPLPDVAPALVGLTQPVLTGATR